MIRIILADDHALFREGVAALIEKEEDMCVVAEADSTDAVIPLLQDGKVDILLLDIDMPGIPGIKLVRHIRNYESSTAVLVLTIHNDEFHLKEYLSAGVDGFVVKSSTGGELVGAIRAVHSGNRYIDPTISHYLVSQYIGHKGKKDDGTVSLSKREREVCAQLALGYTNSEAGQNLGVSKRTIESHRTAIMSKLGLHNRAELVRYAIENHLLPLDQ